ncbi:copper amine oxidase [Paenibacillus oenotherae]|uniref:Copper amine oxidase n=1 Tax=Paenibacillus oenotherae TaxID=1435645 RepID=A0ABS7DA07_9BACL|nr:stalk domain-containing protein [Paenibacillus oenotherae]MBW7476710.1 copper amine oxidase [Paenibacillus oenotherae]
MYRKLRKKRAAAAVLTAALLVGTVNWNNAIIHAASQQNASPYAAAAAVAEAASALNIVAVGDSLTAGYEHGMTESAVPYGYVDRVYEQALYHGRVSIQNFGMLGLKSVGLSAWLNAAAQGNAITAEEAQNNLSSYPRASATIAKTAALKTAIEGANLVIMTIGGNDFTPIIEEVRQNPLTTEQLAARFDDVLAAYETSLQASLRSIIAINPKARIVISDQYLPVPKPSAVNKAVTEEQYAVLLGGVAKLRNAVETLAATLRNEGVAIDTVNISEPFAGKELQYTDIIKGDIHPKQAGYQVMGRAFAETIWGEYREPAVLAAGEPLRVIINGKQLSGGNKPVLKNNTTFLPMRDIANAMNASLQWDGKTQTATIKAGNKEVAFRIGAKSMKVNGQELPLAMPAYLEKSGQTSVTYLPLAALSKGLGYQVEYRKTITTVFINK